MKVKVRPGDLVTYKEESRRYFMKQRVLGYIQWIQNKEGVLSIRWIAPKQYEKAYTVLPYEELVVILKKKDPRVQEGNSNA